MINHVTKITAINFGNHCVLQIVISPVKIVVLVLATKHVMLVLMVIFNLMMGHALVRKDRT